MKQYDVAIIGAGVVGTSIARALSRYALKIALLDARGDVSMGASRANSAIVHAGYDCEPGTNMARLNVRGNALFAQWCEQLDVPLMRTGSLVVAFSPEEEEVLQDLLARAQKKWRAGFGVDFRRRSPENGAASLGSGHTGALRTHRRHHLSF